MKLRKWALLSACLKKCGLKNGTASPWQLIFFFFEQKQRVKLKLVLEK